MTSDQISSKHKKNLFIATIICLIAILLTLAILNFSFGFIIFYLDPEQSIWWNIHSPVFLIIVCMIMLSSVAYEIYIFREGGHSLAKQMNARRLVLSECAPEEVMALELTQKLASQLGISEPAVYVLPKEIGVNVLTAGVNDYDTVIILTWGALQNLDKLELYGLLSYAFNQISTGETRQNIRLKILFSALITFNQLGSEIAKRGFNYSTEQSTQNKFETILVAIGGIIWLMGSLGLLISRFIKYMTLSGRTFKNDTQTKILIGNDTSLQTLLRIYVHHAGSQIYSSHSESIAHMCFANSLSPQSWLNTHPSIEKRIYHLDSQVLKELNLGNIQRLIRPAVLRFLKPHNVNIKLSHRWKAPQPLPIIRIAHMRSMNEDQIQPLNIVARRAEQPKVIQRAMQTGTGTKEVLVAILTLRQHRALVPKNALVSHAIIDALMAIDSRLHVQIFYDACDLLPKMPKSMAHNFLTRLAYIIQADGKIGLLDVLLLEKVKFQLQILPKHVPTASESIHQEKAQLIDALLHVHNLKKSIDLEKRRQLIQQSCPLQADAYQDVIASSVDLGEALHQLSGLLLRDRLKFLDLAEQCLWNDRVITQEEFDVLELLYWRLGIENDSMKDQVLKRNSMLII